MSDPDRDWRRWAYLEVDNWPAAIPEMGPKREHGPYPWPSPTHENPKGVDDYPRSHPNAASAGSRFMGDVCPYCGVPLRWTSEVVLITGDRGVFHDVDDGDDPTPAYHPDCWRDRRVELEQADHMTLDALTDGGDAPTGDPGGDQDNG